jgi:hypothetical protein
MSVLEAGPTPAERVMEEFESHHRYEGAAPPVGEERSTIGRARALVAKCTHNLGYSDRANLVAGLDPNKVLVYDRAFDRFGGGWQERHARGMVTHAGRIEFSRRAAVRPGFLRIAVHEFFHFASGVNREAPGEDGDFIERVSGIARTQLGIVDGELAVEEDYSGFTEAVTEFLTLLASPEGELPDLVLGMQMLTLHTLMRRVVDEQRVQDPSFSLKDVWSIVCHDYFSGSHKFIHMLSKLYPPETMDRFRRFGEDREASLDLLVELYPDKWDGFESDVVAMVIDGNSDSRAKVELERLDKELLGSIKS